MPRGAQPDPAVAAEILEHMYDDLGELVISCDARLMRVLAKSVTRDEYVPSLIRSTLCYSIWSV